MSVQSKPLESPRKPSAVVTRAQLERTRGPIEKFLAVVVFLVGVLGTVVAVHGSWQALFGSFSWGRLALAVFFQAVLTYAQWVYSKDWRIAYASRAIDAAFTAAGYAPLWMAGLVAWLEVQGVAGGVTIGPWVIVWAALAAWFLSWAACLLPAWYPESRLVQ